MKQVTITTCQATIVVVDFGELKKESYLYEFREIYPTEQWIHLGGIKELTEKDWKRIADSFDLLGDINVGYKNYEFEEPVHDTATESGLSLLKANGVVMENKFGEKPFFNPNPKSVTPYADLYEHNCREMQWQQSQDQVWSNPHIFIKL